MIHRSRALGLALSIGLLPAWTAPAADDELAEINRKLDNPLTKIWSLTLQENYSLLDGDRVDGTETQNTLFFQPAMPFQIGDTTLIVRPVFPLVTNPTVDPETGQLDGHTTGYGDTQIFAVIGPSREDGLVWGVGPTFKFPTAGSDELGSGKYQVGPSFLVFHLSKKWTKGVLVQHWWSVAGSDSRPDISRTDMQYIIRKQIRSRAMSIGMGPTVVVDWKADSDDRLTLPIGLGVTKTVRWWGRPVKLRFEPQYSVIRPDDVGAEWNFRIQITPVIPNPFLRKGN
jgi:hypothetical protein